MLRGILSEGRDVTLVAALQQEWRSSHSFGSFERLYVTSSTVELLISKGADVNVPDQTSECCISAFS